MEKYLTFSVRVRHILKTQNIPLIGKWITSLGYGKNSPFRAEVVFVCKQLFVNLKWGTREPILFRDTELEVVRLRSFGSYSIQINDTRLFVKKVVGTKGLYTKESIEEYLKGIIVSKLNTILGNVLKSVFDISKRINELNLILHTELQIDFKALGLQIHDFYIQSISVSDDVQKMIDARSGMEAVGNLDHYMKFKIANAFGNVTNNYDEIGTSLGFSMGLGMGIMLPNLINSLPQQASNGSISDKIKKLKELLDFGAITQIEFDKKKNELLKQL
ncbi:SPFH domain-containing protein [Parasediminibacterium paludis]|uniref:SPFH domain-containing protein n=1 Tax=Parasediminibacterium paludis TaxID=908966 RepID=A0ABV8PVP4_9BACT